MLVEAFTVAGISFGELTKVVSNSVLVQLEKSMSYRTLYLLWILHQVADTSVGLNNVLKSANALYRGADVAYLWRRPTAVLTPSEIDELSYYEEPG